MNDETARPDFTVITYLSKGNPRQRETYKILNDLRIFHILKDYTPILVGTVPLDIDLPESDLDIICEVHDFERFEKLVILEFGHMDLFNYIRKKEDGEITATVNFNYGHCPIELFAQSLATHQQNGYKHMVIEDRILEIWVKGENH